MLSKKVLALDVGKKKIGVAISDILGISANPSGFINASNTKKALEKVGEFIKENDIGTVVAGLPKNMDGTKSEKTEIVDEIVERLEKAINIPVIKWDERLTTVSAYKTMKELNISQKKKNVYADKLAATYILEGYLNSLK